MEREVTQLKNNPQNPRGEVVYDESLRELAMSIQAQGILQPILVTPDNVIVAGHRRVAAAKLANLEAVPVIVKNLSETEQLQVMLIENLQRKDLNVVQEGKAYLALNLKALSVNKICKAVGVCNQRVTQLIQVASLPEEWHPLFASGQIAFGQVRCLVSLEPKEQIRWCNRAIENKWNGAKLANAISQESYSHEKSEYSPAQIRQLRLTSISEALLRLDSRLDSFTDMRTAQSYIRRALSEILERQASARKAVATHVDERAA